MEKNYGDSFEDTPLESVLSGLGVGRLVAPRGALRHRSRQACFGGEG